MRSLSKIILINSAYIKYAEIALNGNVHFIGTQGVGKSTLLRAILFFYNADSQKLGIAKDKKSYAEYYFQYVNSYIIYEVQRETGPFCVMAFKSLNKVCFRFFDGAYDKNYFISTEGFAFESWDKTRVLMDAQRTFYSRKIDRYEEYRDILYGNNDGKKELKRFALMESRQYQNIPRTIQNVFLNSKLEAEFIKQTIIMSLNEEDIKIDLTNYTHHLKGFEEHLADIRKFQDSRTITLCQKIIQQAASIRFGEREMTSLAKQLAYVTKRLDETAHKINQEVQATLKVKGDLDKKFREADGKFGVIKDKLQKEIGGYDSDIRKARERKDYYDRLAIHNIIVRVENKKKIEKQKQDLTNEQNLLTIQFGEITQRFDALKRENENRFQQYKNTSNEEKNLLTSNHFEHKSLIEKEYKKLIDEIEKLNIERVSEARKQLDGNRLKLTNLKIEKAGIINQRFFEQEIGQLENELQEHTTSEIKMKLEAEHVRSMAVNVQKEFDLEEADLKTKHETKRQKLEEQTAKIDVEIIGVQAKIMPLRTLFMVG